MAPAQVTGYSTNLKNTHTHTTHIQAQYTYTHATTNLQIVYQMLTCFVDGRTVIVLNTCHKVTLSLGGSSFLSEIPR